MAGVILACCGLILVCLGVAAARQGRWRLCLWRFCAAGMIESAADLPTRRWLLLALNAVLVILCACLLWFTRHRRKRAPRAYGAKSRARITALVRKAREAARPRPVRRLAPQGG